MSGKKRIDLTGRVFGELTVIRFSPEDSGRNYPKWLCRCSCGVVKAFSQGHMIQGKSRSCGCTQKTQGGHALKHPMWHRWHSMIDRCENKGAKNYASYGARGIKVCERWHKFPLFLEDMEDSFFTGASLDRIDNNGNYEPSNVRWATAKQQMKNTSRTVFIETPWGRMTRSEAAQRAGVPLGRFINRHESGWSVDRLFDPANRGMAANPIRRNQWG